MQINFRKTLFILLILIMILASSHTVALANIMNTNHHLDKRLQYEFLLNIVRPKKRYAKWSKKDKGGDGEIIKEYYGYNDIINSMSILKKIGKPNRPGE